MKLCTETLHFSRIAKTESLEFESTTTNKVDWGKIFGKSETLKTAELKSLVSKEYSVEQKTAEKWIGEELAEFREKIGIYRNPTRQALQEEDEHFEL
jgi:hypothetical protein